MLIGLTILALIITIGAQINVNTTYSKYSKKISSTELKGAEVARKVLDNNGLSNVGVEETGGYLSDHYDPRSKTVHLSSENYNSNSIAAISVACHECGHAIQDKEDYKYMKIRASLVPVVNFSSYAGYFAILLGGLFGSLNLIWLGILAEVIILLFQLITLPVEFDASNRALKELQKYNILKETELNDSKKVLTSAALTYVASVASSVIEILRLILMYTRRDD